MLFNQAFFIRCLIAVVVAIVLFALLPAVLRLVGFPTSADLMLVVKLVVAVCAVLFIIKGS